MLNSLPCFVLAFLLFLSSSHWAKINPFTADRDFLFANGSMSNPAGLSLLSQNQLEVNYSQPFFGYQQLSLESAFLLTKWSFALGYHTFGTSDIPRVAAVTGSSRPTATDYFVHDFQRYVAALSFEVEKGVNFGATATLLKQQLDSDYAESLVADFGFEWQTSDFFWLGLYSQNFFQTPYQWQKSGLIELLSRKFIIQTGLRWDDHKLVASSDFDFYRLAGEARLSPAFSLIADSVWQKNFEMRRLSYGAILELDSWALRYAHVQFSAKDLQADQDQLGLLFRFGR